MKTDYLTRILILIILGLLVYLAIKPSGSNDKYLDLLKQQNEEIIKQRNDNLDSMKKWIAGIKLIDKKETVIRNYYNEKIISADTFTNYNSAVSNIRMWLDTLGTARLD